MAMKVEDFVQSNEILRTTVGSELNGTNIDGVGDHDEMGVYIELPSHVFSPWGGLDHHTHSTQPEGVRSGPGDVDRTMYSLRRYLQLASAGNPNVLLPLYAPSQFVLSINDLGHELRAHRGLFSTKNTGKRFYRYMHDQFQRMMGVKRGHTPNRPELVEEYGFDVKYASLLVRLGLQGIEMMETGGLTLPMPEEQRLMCVGIRTGAYTFDDVVVIAKDLDQRLSRAIDSSSLPPEVDRASIDRLSSAMHLSHWNVKYER